MEKQIKTIGVLTSGGDAPGMNAAVRAVVRTGLHKGYRMIGIQRGYNGLLNGECFEMNLRSVSNIISAGGTILYTARCLEFKTKEGQDRGAAKCRELGIDALVVIGGDGSYRGARELAHRGIPMIGLPGTIDNDIACTDYTIGYDTAMNTALEMIDKLRDTTQSHDRCSVVEVMGRNAGYIALNVAIASGAMAVLLPEKEFDMQRDILDKIAETQKTGKRHFIIIVAEGVGHAQEIANEIQARTGIDSRATILGHVQRGGDFPVDGPGLDAGVMPQLLGMLGRPLQEALGAEGLAVLQQADLGHFMGQIVDVLTFGLYAPLLGDADQLLRVLDLIVAAFLGLVQGVHDLAAMVGVGGGAAGGEAQVVTADDTMYVAAADAPGGLLGDAARAHGADTAASAGFAEAAMGGLVLDPLLPGVSAHLLAVFQQGVGGRFHLFNGG